MPVQDGKALNHSQSIAGFSAIPLEFAASFRITRRSFGPPGVRACRGDPETRPGLNGPRRSKMPKMKTKSGAKKRFRFSANGKIKTGQAYKRHRLISKSKRTRKELKGNLSHSETQRVERWMPYA
jgi:large subunit ribosomal protein L35